MDDSLPLRLARGLLAAGAVTFRPEEPFTWASGLRAPVYCDNRLTLAVPAVRAHFTQAFVGEARPFDPDVIAGVATAGIPQATLVADRLGLPLAYVRAQAKGHGRGNRIEGRLELRQRVVLVEDLVSTGGSAVAAVEAVREAGAEPVAVLAAFSYGLPAAAEAFERAGVPFYALTSLEALLEEAERTGALGPDALRALRAWRLDPEGWEG